MKKSKCLLLFTTPSWLGVLGKKNRLNKILNIQSFEFSFRSFWTSEMLTNQTKKFNKMKHRHRWE